ncbi:MAG TPA: thioredoxin domain-containing protein [Rhizomicrobium sp.]|nr:thioredoxin domain-containing protein [Rhizomicrobium sp.]
MSRNQLDQQSSPYLLLSKDMPVHWRPWGPEALAEAQATGKPIHLSVGYTACHWCHVMNAESYADPEFAALLNENFVNIKVDREERPDIDQLYQTSLSLLGSQGGWPLTMFLTPAGDAFAGGTYMPPVERQGAPSFRTVVDNVLRVYREQPERLAQVAQEMTTKYAELWNRDLRGPLDPAPVDQAAIRIGQRYDIFFGGLLGIPKFPNMPHIELLFRAFLRTGMAPFAIQAQTSLANISMGGIYDHVGGGLHRYATDERWLLPHFEKMLNDNALYIDTLLLHWQYDRNPLYQARIEETVAWMLRDMMVAEGFASSIDADSEGEEGKYYLWSEAEIDAALAGTFTQKFKQVYNVAAQGPVRGKNVLCRIGAQSVFNLSQADEALFKKQREMLLAARSKRVAPLRDDKVLADWNGMAIAALANAGAAMRKTEWTVAAMRAFEFVEKTLGDGDRLYHSWCEGKRQHIGFADDYAHMARAALALWQATNDPKYLARAKSWAHELNEHFWDSQNGGYFFSADEADPLNGRIRSVYDVTQPCANGIMPAVLAKLFMVTLDPAYRERTNAALDAFSGEVSRSYISMTAFLKSLETVIEGLQIVIIGPVNNPKTHELVSAVRGRALPNALLLLIDPAQTLPEGHPAFGKTMDGGRPTAYICQRNGCSAPITNPVTLSQALQLPPRPQQAQPMPQPVGRA